MRTFYHWQNEKFVIFAEKQFEESSKSSLGPLRFSKQELIVGVIDSRYLGKKVCDVVNLNSQVPFLKDVEDAHAQGAQTLLIGVSTRGGGILPEWIPYIRKALELNMNVVNGLHYFISDLDELQETIKTSKGKLIEYRKTDRNYPIGHGDLIDRKKPVRVLSVGTDCNTGKMTSLLALTSELRKTIRVDFIPTGQTGMMIEGRGVCIDALVSDFVAGAIEQEVKASQTCDLVLVEGQGSIIHPSYSGASIGLLHGVMPHYLLFCHQPDRTKISHTQFDIPDLKLYFDIYGKLMEPFQQAPVVGLALNTKFMNEQAARDIILRYEQYLGIPVDDPVRFGPEKLSNVLKDLV